MRKLIIGGILVAMPLLAGADTDIRLKVEGIDISMPGVSIHIGDRDRDGRYWDGYDWRDHAWWASHRGHHIGERSQRGHYWDGHQWRDHAWWKEHHREHHDDDDEHEGRDEGRFCPPGQAKKGRC
ncbi:MAG: DUF2502 domain-containing protein [Gammaproteobacteria bacterium]|nr:DUF2502 domain-containing protein [Gammaproteobacteria bacterium]